MDQNYRSRIAFRKDLMHRHPDAVLGALPSAHAAVAELYAWLTTRYLPVRYPSIFTPQAPNLLRILPLDDTVPCDPPADPLTALRTLGRLLDDDFLFLRPHPDGAGHRLDAFVCCCPSGFALPARLGHTLRDIHAPVPGYAARLATSMDRFFARLRPGVYVRRANVSLPVRHAGEALRTRRSGASRRTTGCLCPRATTCARMKSRRRSASMWSR